MKRRTPATDRMDARDLLYAAVVRQALIDLHEPDEAEVSRWFLEGTLVLQVYEERQRNAAHLLHLQPS